MTEKIEKYTCSICQCILQEPVMITKCFHPFCTKCIKSFINSNVNCDLHCPLCRQKFEKDDYVLAFDLQQEIENCKVDCKKCGASLPILQFEDHQDACPANTKSNNGTILGNYNCTLCTKTNMNRLEYVKHIEDIHSQEEGVCAICSAQPWGDKNYKTYLLGHVDLRHKKDKTQQQKDAEKEEEEILRQVMLKSLTEK